ncbi:glycosyltransferase [Cohnella algarum]|uniref:glycosyltransferase n=1 Tax=Cohnella algarum TaxID=2044859 RepID=UPI001967311E|nr:glycosyltransferase [Cohnella algarum]MBN2982673.1 glycosyltransferase [Cohnella algarum]
MRHGATAAKTRSKRKRTSVKVRRTYREVKTKKKSLKLTFKKVRKLKLKKSYGRLRRGKRKGSLRLAKKGKRARLAVPVHEHPPEVVEHPPHQEPEHRGEPEEPADTGAPGFYRGINLVGFLRAELGLGESVRLAARSLEANRIPFGILDYKEVISEGMGDSTWVHKEMGGPLYKVNVFHMNSDSLPHCHNYFGHDLWHNRFNIGVWHWELPEFPDELCEGFNYVQEIWAPTTYVQQIIAQKSRVPVVRIPHGIHVDFIPELNRDAFGLPHDRYLFFMMFDLQSTMARKNPQGVIDAFKMAFDKDDPRVGLVLKVNNSSLRPEDVEQIRPLIDGHSNIFLMDRLMNRIEVNSLINSTDCYVSLHRAEGFGLGLAEAMFLGKPVIGTNYSGNTDFMSPENSCLVDYTMVHVGDVWAGPYQAHQIWAEPDIAQAAGYMQQLAFNPEWRTALALRGQETIRTQFSPEVAGRMMKQRLKELGWY